MPKNFVEKVREIVGLLRHNPNLILYGPPGTGKTYTAQKVVQYLDILPLIRRSRFFSILVTDWDNHWDRIRESKKLRNFNNSALKEDEILDGHTFYSSNLFDPIIKDYSERLEGTRALFLNSKDERVWIGKVTNIRPCGKKSVIDDCVAFKPELEVELQDLFDKIVKILPSRNISKNIKLENLGPGWYVLDMDNSDDFEFLLELKNLLCSNNENKYNFEKWCGEVYWKMVQFHPSYNYDDFVVGIEAKTEDKQVVFEKVWRALGEMSRRALVSLVFLKEGKDKIKKYISGDEKEKAEIYNEAKERWGEISKNKEQKKQFIKNALPFVLIIDEINRANLPAVLGELIYALEYRGEEIDIMYGEKLIIPPNLYIIGTMNTADRSAGRIDYAIRRRFTFYPMHAEINRADDYGQPLMEAVNKFIEMNISPEYDPEDIKIGHTYFMGESADEIAYKFLYQVVPLLYEYIQDGLIRAEREEGKGYKIELKRDLETGDEKKNENEKKVYYLRGGRLYKDENNELKIEDFWFMKKTTEQTETKNNDKNSGESGESTGSNEQN